MTSKLWDKERSIDAVARHLGITFPNPEQTSIAERLGIDPDDIKEMVGTFDSCVSRASSRLRRSIPERDPETWRDMDIEIVRLRIAIVRELKAQIAADTKLLFRLEVRRALTPLRSALSRLWQFARMCADGLRLWVSR
jgi:hypothetical protein